MGDMKKFLTAFVFLCLAINSVASSFNVGATMTGGVYTAIGIGDADGPKIIPSEGGYGGALSIDMYFPFVSDLKIRTGVMAEYRDYRSYKEIDDPVCLGELGCDKKLWDDDVILSLLYLEIPLFFRVAASDVVNLEGGPIVGFNMLSKFYGPYMDDFSEKWLDLSDYTNLVEVGFSVNLVLWMTEHVEMNFRIAYMITDVLDEDELGYDITSQTIKYQAALTYWFGINEKGKSSEPSVEGGSAPAIN